MTQLSRPVKISAFAASCNTWEATAKSDITWQDVGVGVMTAAVAFSVGVFARALGVERAGGERKGIRAEGEASRAESEEKSRLLSVSQNTFRVSFSAVRSLFGAVIWV